MEIEKAITYLGSGVMTDTYAAVVPEIGYVALRVATIDEQDVFAVERTECVNPRHGIGTLFAGDYICQELARYSMENCPKQIHMRSGVYDSCKAAKLLFDSGKVHGRIHPRNILFVRDSFKLAPSNGIFTDEYVNHPFYSQFIAPEGLNDVYSLGAVVLYLRWKQSSVSMGFYNLEEVMDSLQARGELGGFARIIKRATHKDPSKRYKNPNTLWFEVKKAAIDEMMRKRDGM